MRAVASLPRFEYSCFRKKTERVVVFFSLQRLHALPKTVAGIRARLSYRLIRNDRLPIVFSFRFRDALLIVLGAPHRIVQNLVCVCNAYEGIFDPNAQFGRLFMKMVRVKMAR